MCVIHRKKDRDRWFRFMVALTNIICWYKNDKIPYKKLSICELWMLLNNRKIKISVTAFSISLWFWLIPHQISVTCTSLITETLNKNKVEGKVCNSGDNNESQSTSITSATTLLVMGSWNYRFNTPKAQLSFYSQSRYLNRKGFNKL